MPLRRLAFTPALDVAHVLQIMAQIEHAALAEHDVVIQILAQALPQLHRFFIQMGGFVPEIIGADDGGITAGVAAAQPAFFQHGDIADAVFFGEIIRRGQGHGRRRRR